MTAPTNTMTLTGCNLVAAEDAAAGTSSIHGVNPVDGSVLEPAFHEATPEEIAGAVHAAVEAFNKDGDRPAAARAALLEAVADGIEGLGDALVHRVMAETGLPEGRVRGERGRTTGQLRKFADLIREGSWIDARIDTALPDRAPIPKPDIRNMQVPLGPVAVFGASNFPLAFSVAGGDTASAMAAGCPVVCKAHPAHPGTSEMVGRAIRQALADHGFHPGNFSLLHGGGQVGQALVKAPGIKAVGFTGSLLAGRAIFDIAAAREEPIPVYAEMGSVNPVFLLPGAVKAHGEQIAEGLAGSVTLGSGQFCTNPGLVFVTEGEGLDHFLASLEHAIAATGHFTMLHGGIANAYSGGVDALRETGGVRVLATGGAGGDGAPAAAATAHLFVTDATTFRANPRLHEEVFGPSTIVVKCASPGEMAELGALVGGNLTATVHMTEEDGMVAGAILRPVSGNVGRLIINSFPTGVEVCPSMHHGGPYPATTDSRSTSVGTAAIGRFTRPLCFQGFPGRFLPPELQDSNPRGILRLVDGVHTRDPVA